MRKKKQKYKSLINRLTGFSTPVFGFSWKALKAERDVVRELINFLEDRRVLYVPYILEIPGQVTSSVLDIRAELTRAIQALPEDSGAVGKLKAMRAACRKFLEEPAPEFNNVLHFQRRHAPDDDFSPAFFVALGELRTVFGTHVAALAVQYGIDVEVELTTIFPAVDQD